MYTEMHIESGI